MKNWAPLWNSIVESSIWDEPDVVMKVFVTMMAVKDSDHIVRKSAYQIAFLARKTEVEVLDALKVLSSPDTKRIGPQPHEGRRIQAVEEGWLILNGEKYRAMVQLEAKRARNRRAQAAFRERKRAIPVDNKQDLIRQHEANAEMHRKRASEFRGELESFENSSPGLP